MIDINSKEISNNVFIRDFTDKKFKTMKISMTLIMPLAKETVSDYAILPSLLTQITKECPSIILLAKKLAKLYGASFDTTVSTLGENQLLNFSSSAISDDYVLDGENMSKELSKMLCEAVFNPLVDEDDEFVEENYRQQRRQLLETIEADYSDKMIYVKNRAREIIFGDEPAGLGSYGNRETVDKIKREGLCEKLKYILKNARVEIFVLGNCNFEDVKETFKTYFDAERNSVSLVNDIKYKYSEVKNVTEELKLSQSKLVMGFRADITPEQVQATKLMSVILGGGVSSKLFLNVREKLSLCYYCSASFDTKKATMLVNSGVETKNIEIAKEAILKEIDDMKKGNFTDEDIEFAKLTIFNSYNAINDSLAYKETWYMSQVLNDEFLCAEDIIDIISKITREEIIETANALNLDTVFVLKGVSDDE